MRERERLLIRLVEEKREREKALSRFGIHTHMIHTYKDYRFYVVVVECSSQR